MGYFSVRTRALIVRDNSAAQEEITTLKSGGKDIRPVTNYMLHLQAKGTGNGGSKSTQKAALQAIELFLDYVGANEDCFNNRKELFNTFVARLDSGTMDADFIDPSGLRWEPKSTKVVNKHINSLTNFFDWLGEVTKNVDIQPNPLIKATSHEKLIHEATWHHRKDRKFLAHIKDKHRSNYVSQHRQNTGKRKLINQFSDHKVFPEKYIKGFINEGLLKASDRRVAVRDACIVLLMHGTGVRLSEALGIWTCDVLLEPTAKVRIYDEVDGVAPDNWKDKNGSSNRKAYLKEEFGRVPRRDMAGTELLGSKSKLVDSKDGFKHSFWIDYPANYKDAFTELWLEYSEYRMQMQHFGGDKHPYAWVNFRKGAAQGGPLTLHNFVKHYGRALNRIDLEADSNKGLNPHGHRHSWGTRGTKLEINPLILQKGLHHASPESTAIYSHITPEEVTELLDKAVAQFESKAKAKLENHESSLGSRSLLKSDIELLD